MNLPLAISCSSPHFKIRAEEISAQLSLPLVSETLPEHTNEYAMLIVVGEHGTGIQLTGSKQPSPLYVDFVAGAAAHRRQFGGGKGQAIAKAVGLSERTSLKVVDATAGLGRDAFVLASLGCVVVLVERSPIIAVLLADGLARAKLDDEVEAIANRMSLATSSGVDYLAGLWDENLPDVIYLDPMFPSRGKSAKVKKDMQIFHQLIGQDDDADLLLAPALEKAKYRVVVKRPAKAPYLSNQKPTYELKGKSNRFDIYVNRSLKHP